jgi:alpha-beta hydrolase superfamily lysophospholipase
MNSTCSRGDRTSSSNVPLQQRRQDQLIERAVTAGWFFSMRRAVEQVHKHVSRIQLPLLILQGDQDHVVDPQATAAWFDKLQQPDRTLQMLPGHLHELLQESDRVQTTERILTWLDERLPA